MTWTTDEHRADTKAVTPGGGTWSVGELPQLTTAELHQTGIVPLDEVLVGGVCPGEVLSIDGPPRSGVSRLAIRLALGLGRAASVCIVNGHLTTRRLLPIIEATASLLDFGPPRAIDVASWMPLPDFPDRPAWFEKTYDVVVIDCLEEMTTSHWEETTPLLETARRLRECARRSSSIVLMTGRSSQDARGKNQPLGHDLASVVLGDVSDAHLQLGRSTDGAVVVEIEVRGGRRTVQRLSMSSEGVARLQQL